MASSAKEVTYYHCSSCQISYDPDEIIDGEELGMPKADLYGNKNPSCFNCGNELRLMTKEYEEFSSKNSTVHERRLQNGVLCLEAKLG